MTAARVLGVINPQTRRRIRRRARHLARTAVERTRVEHARTYRADARTRRQRAYAREATHVRARSDGALVQSVAAKVCGD